MGVDCPKEGCGGYLTEKRSRRGKVFFGCSNYSKTGCDFVSWDRPLPQPCPKCGAKFVVQKVSKAGTRIRCLKEDCGYVADGESPESGEAPAPAPTGTA
ncbi:MAG TPA: type I DNA topoisomerase [Polyangia bacterium]